MNPNSETPTPVERAARALADPLLHGPRAERGCPAGEVWIDFVARALPAVESERWLDHLAACPDCAAEVRALGEVRAWADDARRRHERAAPRPRWASLTAVAAGLLAALTIVLALATLRADTRARAAVAARAELAARLDAALGERDALRAGDEAARRRVAAQAEELDRLSRPRVNVPVVDLAPRDLVRGGGGMVPAISRASGWATLLLHPHALDGTSYAVEVLSPEGATLERADGLVPGADASLTLALPTARLPLGTLRLRLLRETPGTPAAVDAFDLRIEER
ncbi:MAG: hypothetical protein U0X73_07890 [Thermoanaerobaculia bacterium]